MALNVVSSDRLSTNVKTSNLATGLSGKIGESKNLIINGAMNVAQRGTSSTSGNYQTVDRFYPDWNGTDEAMTQAQVDVTADTDPWNLGFRKALKLTNGNQTSGAGAADDGYILYRLEAQDIANCGWDYTSTSSYITYSFWVKSSVAQTFYGVWSTHDGTSKAYPISFALSADTWTKVTGSIPGVSGLQFDNNNAHGLDLRIYTFLGTDKTASGVSLNTWANTNWSERTPDYTSTWWTTNDATFELTGFQLEVGSTATEFEHRTYGDELARCKRYYQQYPEIAADGYAPYPGSGVAIMTTTSAGWAMNYDTMRAAPTVSWSGNHRMVEINTDRAVTGFAAHHGSASTGWMVITASGGGMTAGNAAIVGRNNDTTAFIKFSAEL